MARGEKRLRCQDLLTRLRAFGVVQVRQKGSHILLLKPESPGSDRGPTFPVPCHKPTSDVNPRILRALLRTFQIDEQVFWSE